jgi:aspartate racemase
MTHWVIHTLHWALADWLALGLLFPRLAALYAPTRLPKRDDSEPLSSQVAYWRRQLADDLPKLQLFTDHDWVTAQAGQPAHQQIELSPETGRALRALCRKEEITPFVALAATFAVLLHRYTGQDDIVIGTYLNGFVHTPGEPSSRPPATPLPLRIDLSGNPTFTTLLQRVHQVSRTAYANRDVPQEQLIELMRTPGIGGQPLCQVMFAFHHADDRGDGAAAAWMPTARDRVAADAFLTLVAGSDDGDDLRGVLRYSPNIFDADTMARIGRHFRVVVEAATAQPATPISQLPLLPDSERQQLVAWSRRSAGNYPRDRCVHELFEEQAARTPDAVALVHADQIVSYGELNRRANQIAHHLRTRGVGADHPVGVCLDRSAALITSLLAILKAGGAYVALEPTANHEHLAYMVRDVGMSLVIGRGSEVRALLGDLPITCVDPDGPEIARQSTVNLGREAAPHNLAYIIYTSGTTGTPKGVEVPHRGIVRLAFGLDSLPGDSSDVFLLLSSMSFDLSTLEIWHPLLHGARLAIYPGPFGSFQELASVLERERVTSLWLTASLYNAIIDECPEALSSVRDLVIGGEPLSVPHVVRGLDLLPATQIINGYGPTEATTFTHCYAVPRPHDRTVRSIPIGWPIAATEGWILDPYLNPAPIGIPGELYVGGDGLARGYRNQPALTAKKFIPHPFDRTPGARLYATGDRARFLPDGRVEYLGRSDYQVKIRGFRVELEGIEATLVQHPAVRQAVVTAESEDGDTRLLAYVVLDPAATCPVAQLRAFLEAKLPDYMVPSQFTMMSSLPLTASGKVNRRALPKCDRPAAAAHHRDERPGTPTEANLAAIWAELFHVTTIGIDDNFFDLGGHSLLAARLFARIEHGFGKKLPLSILLRSPTVSQLAAAIDEAGDAGSQSALAPIQPHGTKRPLFCVAGIGGSVLGLGVLGQYLGEDQPLYGLRLHPSDPRSYPTVEARAARYLDEIFAVAPDGPYSLAGYSSGGIIAFEIARQLRARGHVVSLLAVFDQGPAEPEPTLPFGFSWMVDFSRNLPYWFIDDFLHAEHGEMIGRLRSKARVCWGTIRRTFGGSRRQAESVDIRDVVGMWQAPEESRQRLQVEYAALENYTPKHYDGRLTLFRARARPLFRVCGRDLGWSDLATTVDVTVVPGSHVTMLRDPYVRVVADQLKRCLAQPEQSGV